MRALLDNSCLGSHIAAIGWKDETDKPTINPNPGTATYGFREYGTTDLSGNAISLSSRKGVYVLSASQVSQYYSTRAQIFSAIGWSPTP